MSDGNGDNMLPRVDEEDPIEMDKCTYDNNIKSNCVDNQFGSLGSPSGGDTTLSDIISAPPAPTLSMVTKHQNGSLNLWQLTFGDKSKFSQVSGIEYNIEFSIFYLYETTVVEVLFLAYARY